MRTNEPQPHSREVTGVDLDIEFMLAAAKVNIPNTADRLYDLTKTLHGHLTTLNQQSALAGDPAFLRTMLTVGGDVYEVLRPGVTSLNNAAGAVLKTAMDFKNTDEDAARDFERMNAAEGLTNLKDVDRGRTGDAPKMKDPERLGAGPVPSTPEPESPGDDAEEREENERNSKNDHDREKRRG